MQDNRSGKIHRRETEPELMDESEQVRAYAEADFSETDTAMVERLQQLSPIASPRRILDLGCGPGNISFLVARAWPDAEVLGLDGAPNMIRYARTRLKTHYPELENLRFDVVNLPAPEDFFGKKFDLVVSNSLLHHLHDPFVLWKEVKKAAVPGAFFFIADLRRPDTYEQARHFRETYAGDAPAVLKHDFYCSLLAAFSKEEIGKQLRQEGIRQFTIDQPTDRHLHCYGRVE